MFKRQIFNVLSVNILLSIFVFNNSRKMGGGGTLFNAILAETGICIYVFYNTTDILTVLTLVLKY